MARHEDPEQGALMLVEGHMCSQDITAEHGPLTRADRRYLQDSIGYLIGDLTILSRMVQEIDGGAQDTIEERKHEAIINSGPNAGDIRERTEWVRQYLDDNFVSEAQAQE